MQFGLTFITSQHNSQHPYKTLGKVNAVEASQNYGASCSIPLRVL
jgi:hypothetical protein